MPAESLKECQKRMDYFVSYEIAEPGVEVYNKFENAHYVTDEKNNVILTGTRQEQWVTTLDKLKKTYTGYKEGDKYGEVSPSETVNNFYEFSDKEQTIQTAWGTSLHCKVGDAIVYAVEGNKPNLNDRWVVDRGIFEDTYKYKS